MSIDVVYNKNKPETPNVRLKLHVADFRTGETRGARHEVSKCESTANDSVEREGNPRKRPTEAMVFSRKR